MGAISFGSGFYASIIKVILYIALKDVTYNQLKAIATRRKVIQQYKRWQPEDEEDEESSISFSKSLMLDYVSGLVSEFLLLPMTVIIRKLQSKSDLHNLPTWQGSFIRAMKHIWKTEGIMGFYRGLPYHAVDGLLIYFGTMAFFAIFRAALLLFFKKSKTSKQEEKEE